MYVVSLGLLIYNFVLITALAMECNVKFNRVGCYKDDMHKPRPLPRLLFSDREGPEGKFIDWKNWDSYIEKVVCRCAERAAKDGFSYFGMQFYGECWSGDGGASYTRAGSSPHCITKNFDKCQERSNQICVGESHSSFVYMLSNNDGHCQVNYEKAGCYKNNQEERSAYPTRLFTDNNPESGLYSNVSTGFTHWDSYVFDLACRCASKAKNRGFEAFSLQNFGECWAGPRLESSGNADAEACIGENIAEHCQSKHSVCVGRENSNFVFTIQS